MTREDGALLEQMKSLAGRIRSYGESLIPNIQLKKITDAVIYYIELIDIKDTEIYKLKDLRNNSVLVSQEDVDFLQFQNQQYADTVHSLEAKIAELEHEGQLQWDTHQMCQIINLKRISELEYQLEDNHTRAEEIISSREKHIEILHNRIAELEAQSKALTDMVEMQSEKISRLEAPKSCDGCKYYDEETSYMCASHCTSCKRYFYDFYEPKDNKWIK